MKVNRFLHLNEQPKRILCYLVRLFDVKLSKIWHHFTKEIYLRMIYIQDTINESCSPKYSDKKSFSGRSN